MPGTEKSPVILGKHIHPNVMEYSDKVRTCIMRGCLARAYYEPTLGLSYDGTHYIWMAFPGWLMCEHHSKQIGLEDLIDGYVFGKGVSAFVLIQQSFNNQHKYIPLREFTKLKWRDA